MQRNNFTADKVWKKIRRMLSSKLRQCFSVRGRDRQRETETWRDRKRQRVSRKGGNFNRLVLNGVGNYGNAQILLYCWEQ